MVVESPGDWHPEHVSCEQLCPLEPPALMGCDRDLEPPPFFHEIPGSMGQQMGAGSKAGGCAPSWSLYLFCLLEEMTLNLGVTEIRLQQSGYRTLGFGVSDSMCLKGPVW